MNGSVSAIAVHNDKPSCLLYWKHMSDVLVGCDQEILDHLMLLLERVGRITKNFDEYFAISAFWLTLVKLRRLDPNKTVSPYGLADKIISPLAININHFYEVILTIKSSDCLIEEATILDAFVSNIDASIKMAQVFFFMHDVLKKISTLPVLSNDQFFFLIKLCIFLSQKLGYHLVEVYVLTDSLSFPWKCIFFSLTALRHALALDDLDLIKCFTILHKLSSTHASFSVDFFLLNDTEIRNSSQCLIEYFYTVKGEVFDYSTFDLTHFFMNSYAVDMEMILWNDPKLDSLVKLLSSLARFPSCSATILCLLWKGFFDLYPSYTSTLTSFEFISCISAIAIIFTNIDGYYVELLNETQAGCLSLHSRLDSSLVKIATLAEPSMKILSSSPVEIYYNQEKHRHYFDIIVDKWMWDSMNRQISDVFQFWFKRIICRLKSILPFFIRKHVLQFSISARRMLWQLVLFSITKVRARLLTDGICIEVIIMCAIYTSCRLLLIYPYLSTNSLSEMDDYYLSFRYILSIYLQDPSKIESSFRQIPIGKLCSVSNELGSIDEIDIITYYNGIFLPAVKPLLCNIERRRDDVFPEFVSMMNTYVYPTRILRNTTISIQNSYQEVNDPSVMKKKKTIFTFH